MAAEGGLTMVVLNFRSMSRLLRVREVETKGRKKKKTLLQCGFVLNDFGEASKGSPTSSATSKGG